MAMINKPQLAAWLAKLLLYAPGFSDSVQEKEMEK